MNYYVYNLMYNDLWCVLSDKTHSPNFMPQIIIYQNGDLWTVPSGMM